MFAKRSLLVIARGITTFCQHVAKLFEFLIIDLGCTWRILLHRLVEMSRFVTVVETQPPGRLRRERTPNPLKLQMNTARSGLAWNMARPNAWVQTAILVCLVAGVSYLSARLGGALALRPPIASPLWPGCAILVGVLLLVPRKLWLILILAAFTAFVLYDLQAGVNIRSIAIFILA